MAEGQVSENDQLNNVVCVRIFSLSHTSFIYVYFNVAFSGKASWNNLSIRNIKAQVLLT